MAKKMPELVKKAALDVWCPHCKVNPKEPCLSRRKDGTTARLSTPHSKRVVRAFQLGVLTVSEKRS